MPTLQNIREELKLSGANNSACRRENFLGWLLTAFLIYFAYRLVEQQIGIKRMAPVPTSIAALPLGAYAIFLINGLLPGVIAIEALRIIALLAMGFPLLAAAGRIVTSD